MGGRSRPTAMSPAARQMCVTRGGGCGRVGRTEAVASGGRASPKPPCGRQALGRPVASRPVHPLSQRRAGGSVPPGPCRPRFQDAGALRSGGHPDGFYHFWFGTVRTGNSSWFLPVACRGWTALSRRSALRANPVCAGSRPGRWTSPWSTPSDPPYGRLSAPCRTSLRQGSHRGPGCRYRRR